jgi:hypothetical protein
VPQLASTLPEFAGRIRTGVATIALDILNSIWTETQYRYMISSGPFTEPSLITCMSNVTVTCTPCIFISREKYADISYANKYGKQDKL